MLETRAVPLPAVVPSNLLPTALPDLLMVHDTAGLAAPEGNLTAFFHKTQGQTPSGGLAFGALEMQGAALFDEGALKTRLEALGADLARPVVFGPRGAGGDSTPVREVKMPEAPSSGGAVATTPQIGIIDAGIAFWNPAFGGRFASFGGLCPEPGAGELHRTLSRDELQDMTVRGSTRAGDQQNRAALAQRLPGSVFDREDDERPLFPADGFAHGTAMTELVLSEAPETAQLHGLELPKSVLRDLSGGQMRAVIDAALRAVVLQAAETMAEASNRAPFRMVVLLAFGYMGGPHDPAISEHEMFTTLRQTFEEFAKQGIEIELVVPMGNHLQHKLFADLHGGRALGWRLLPDDYSANTLELIHGSAQATLQVTGPDGQELSLDLQAEGLRQLVLSGVPVGAVWTQALSKPGWMRTRLCLAPTASHKRGAPVAPFGSWSVSVPKAQSAQVWVLRDETGFEADPRRPARGSWLEDAAYPDRNAIGMPPVQDAIDYDGLVRRAGTASLLSAFNDARVITVGAQWKRASDGAQFPAPYSGASLNGVPPKLSLCLGAGVTDAQRPIGPFGQRAVLGNGSDIRFRAAGTSLTAALAAGQRAVYQSSLNAVV